MVGSGSGVLTKVDRLTQYLGTADGQRAFIEWLSSDVTQLMLSASRELVAPVGLGDAPSGEAALYRLGDTVGGNRVLNFMSNPLPLVEAKRMQDSLSVSPRYGADSILKEVGYKEQQEEEKK